MFRLQIVVSCDADPSFDTATKIRQLMLFSATLDGEVGELAHTYTKDPARFEARREIENADGVIEHDFVPATPDGKRETFGAPLRGEGGPPLAVVRAATGGGVGGRASAVGRVTWMCWGGGGGGGGGEQPARNEERRAARIPGGRLFSRGRRPLPWSVEHGLEGARAAGAPKCELETSLVISEPE